MSVESPAGVPGIDVANLARWLTAAVPDIGEITGVELIAGGRSNLTYRIELTGEQRIVLRRPPLGHVLPTAHDMTREHRVLSGLSATGAVPVPRPLALCTDEDVLGAPFYVMEYVDGRVLNTPAHAAEISAAGAQSLSAQLAKTLADIHLADLEAAGLTDFGRPDGYMARQLRRWGQQWERSRAAVADEQGELPEYDRLVARLTERLPTGGPTGLVHGDYRLENTLVQLQPEPRIAAIVDWEMSTLGDPLADLGLTLMYWSDPDEDKSLPVGSSVTSSPGFYTPSQFADRYAELTGFDLADLDFYVAFGCFKLAVVAEGIYARFRKKETVGEGFEVFGFAVPALIGRAHRVLDKGSPW